MLPCWRIDSRQGAKPYYDITSSFTDTCWMFKCFRATIFDVIMTHPTWRRVSQVCRTSPSVFVSSPVSLSDEFTFFSPQTVSCPSDSDDFSEPSLLSVRLCENQLITAIVHTQRRIWTNSLSVHFNVWVSMNAPQRRIFYCLNRFFTTCDRLYWKWPNAEMRPVIDSWTCWLTDKKNKQTGNLVKAEAAVWRMNLEAKQQFQSLINKFINQKGYW